MPTCPYCTGATLGSQFALGTILPADSTIKYTVIYCRNCDKIIAALPPK